MTHNWPLTTKDLPDGGLELEAAFLARHWYDGMTDPLYALASTGHIASNYDDLVQMWGLCGMVVEIAADAHDRAAYRALREWCYERLNERSPHNNQQEGGQ